VDSRPLLNKLKKVGILIDSKSFEESLNNSNRTSFALLNYSNMECVTYIRSPFSSNHEELTIISQYELTIPEKPVTPMNPPGLISYEKNDRKFRCSFTYQSDNIKNIARTILKKTSICQDEFDLFSIVCVLASFNSHLHYGHSQDEFFLLITQNDLLLKKRLQIESIFLPVRLNIMTIEEASHFLDLFFKKNGNYLTGGNDLVNRGGWYRHSLRSKLPHLNSGEPIIAALANRMKYALMALDEIGNQYYHGVDNDTQDDTLYHFNYLISLITGIFDNLALKTNAFHRINFPIKTRISLSSKNGNDFLKKVYEKDPVLRKLIDENRPLINVIYLFRELVVHREGLDPLSFRYNSNIEPWQANLIKISKNELNEIHLCGDKPAEYDNISNWGVYTVCDDVFLEPYHFSLEVLKKLIPFVDKYLELLQYSSFIEEQKRINGDVYWTIKSFEESHLGF
jgi:hypothetical protein